MMETIDVDQSLGALVAERPALAEAFEQLRLDYCCGGAQTLTEACRRRGLDPRTVVVMLESLLDPARTGRLVPHDLRGATVAGLCEHIVSVHHDRLRRDLPRIAELLATVVRVHGGEHPELHDLERLFTALARDLLAHLESEEERLFPVVLAAADGDKGAVPLDRLIAEHEAEHASTGDALAALRELAGGYLTESAYCGTHRRLLEELQAFELDLHQHVHEENNLLFPRLRTEDRS